jgi:hypothetical protein
MRADVKRHLDVLSRRQRRNQVEGLEDDTNLRIPDAGQIAFAHPRHIYTVQHQSAARRGIDTC